MKKILSVFLAVVLLAVAFTGCSKKGGDEKQIKIGASVTPHAEILEVVKDILAKDGYTLEIVEYNDYILPNTATESGELDGNYFQHLAYLEDFNANNGTHLVSVADVHYEPFGIYAGQASALADIKEGDTIAIPNDGTNEARALFLLEAVGLITLKEGIDFTATILDIADNPRNIDIREIEAGQLTRSLPDVAVAVINGNYAIEGGLKVSEALAVEKADSQAAKTYANALVVKEGNENSPKIQALVKALLSDEVRTFINETYDTAVVPVF